MMPFEHERILAREAARMAGQLCLAIRSETITSLACMEKGGYEPVTVADYGAQAVVLSHVAQHFPADGILAEERASDFDELTTNEQRLHVVRHVSDALGRSVSLDEVRDWLDHGRNGDKSRVWIVDPIDGTKGFLRGDQFAIAVALLVDAQLKVGVLACPLLPYGSGGATEPRGVLAVAVHGQGATLEPLSGDGPVRPMRVSTRSSMAEARALESVEVTHTDHSFSQRVFEVAGVGRTPVHIDSQAKYAMVADGRAEFYLRHSPNPSYRHKAWDHAAGVLIVQEAGGRVTDLHGCPLDFSDGAWIANQGGILSSNGAVHNALLEAIAQVGIAP